LTGVLTQSSDGVVTLASIEHLLKHVRYAHAVAEHVSTDQDSLFGRSSPPDVDGVGVRSHVQRCWPTRHYGFCQHMWTKVV